MDNAHILTYPSKEQLECWRDNMSTTLQIAFVESSARPAGQAGLDKGFNSVLTNLHKYSRN